VISLSSQRIPGRATTLQRRQGDVPQLVAHFVEIYARHGKRISHIPKETLDAFTSYSWPGNVRELQNLVERAVIWSDDGVLPNPLPAVLPNPLSAPHKKSDDSYFRNEQVHQFSKSLDPGGTSGGRLGYWRTSGAAAHWDLSELL